MITEAKFETNDGSMVMNGVGSYERVMNLFESLGYSLEFYSLADSDNLELVEACINHEDSSINFSFFTGLSGDDCSCESSAYNLDGNQISECDACTKSNNAMMDDFIADTLQSMEAFHKGYYRYCADNGLNPGERGSVLQWSNIRKNFLALQEMVYMNNYILIDSWLGAGATARFSELEKLDM